MAVTVEELRATLRMEMKPFMRDLQQMNGVSAKAARQVEGTWRAANKRLDGIGKNMARSLIAPMAGIGAVLGTREVASLADEWTIAGNKIAAASVVAGRQARTLSELNEVARATRSGLSETADLYAKLLRSTAGVAKSELEVARATEIVNKAFKAGGAAASEQAAGILQLAQGLGSGMLQGDELRSVRENAPLLAQAIADYFGTTIAGLKELGSEGQLTSEKIFKAILAAQSKVEGAFKATNSTIAEGFTMVNNAMIEYVGTADAGYGVTQQLVGGLTILADNFDKTADVALQLAGVIAGALIGRSLLKMISTLGLAGSALINFTRALTAARTMAGLSLAFSGLGAAAGPVGLLIGGAVVSSLMLYNSTVGASSEASEVYAAALKEVQDAAKDAGDAVEEASGKIARGMPKKIEGGIALSLEEIEAGTQRVIDQFDNLRNVSFDGVPQGEVDKVRALGEQFRSGAITAEKLASELDAVTRANPAWEAFTSSVEGFVLKLREAEQATRLLRARLADLRTAGGRSAKDDILPIDINAIAAEAYEKEALRRAALGKSQLTLETEIAKVRNDALKEGITLTEQQIETIAKANIAGDAARSAEARKPKAERDNDYERLTKSIADRTAAILAETEAVRQLDPTIDDYGFALEKARAEQELLNAAQKAGLEITPALKKEINQAAEQFALATVEANKLAEAQDKIRQRAEEWQDTQKDALRGIVDDLIAGKSAAEAFAGALQKIADKLLDMAFDDLFSGMFKSGGGGGIFGSIGSIFGFDKGGYTGHGGKYEPAGVVHKGEYVFDQDAVKKAGGPAALDAMRRGLKGYAAGGYVGASLPSAPTMPRLQVPTNSNTQSITFAPVIDARGADSAAVARLAQEMDKQRREFSANVLTTMRQAKATRQWKG